MRAQLKIKFTITKVFAIILSGNFELLKGRTPQKTPSIPQQQIAEMKNRWYTPAWSQCRELFNYVRTFNKSARRVAVLIMTTIMFAIEIAHSVLMAPLSFLEPNST